MGINHVKKKAVFLDRDGVLIRTVVRNGKPFSIGKPADLQLLPDVARSLNRLRGSGFLLIVATNQPDVARGTRTQQEVEAIHNELMEQGLPIDSFCVCYHDDQDGCFCRKPKPGMLINAAEEHDLDLHASFMIGDRWRDVEAGRNAGCTTVFIDYEYDEKLRNSPDRRVESISEAVEWILSRDESRKESLWGRLEI